MSHLGNLPLVETCPTPPNDPIFSAWTGGCTVETGGCVGTGGTVYNWGQASSCNIVNSYMSAQANINTTVINQQNIVQSNTIIVNNDCDPSVSACKEYKSKGKINQNNSLVDVSAVQLSYVSNTAQQILNLSILQDASSVVSGLNVVPQSATSGNVLNTFMRTGITINTNITQYCDVTQSNYLEVNNNNYGTVKLFNNVNQSNIVDNYKCTQLAVTRNNILQTLTENLSQIADARAQGISVFAILMVFGIVICVFLLVGGGIVVKTEGSLFKIMGPVTIGVGLMFIMFYFFIRPKLSLWYGMSPGIPASDCSDKFKYSSKKYYDVSRQAKKEFDDDGKYVAMDYIIDTTKSTDPDFEKNGPGTATFYTGDVHDTPLCLDIIATSGKRYQLITIRNPVYVNVSLKGETPGEIEGDVCIDIDTGNMFYKFPTSPTIGPSNMSWQTPSYVQDPRANPDVQDNAFDGSPTNAKLGNENKIYFYIDINQTTLLYPKKESIANYPIEGFGPTAPIGRTYKLANVKTGDYFLVPYPYGPDSQGSETYEQYQYAGVYYLYSATEVNGKFQPNWGEDHTKSPSPPINHVNGYGIVPEFEWENHTLLKFQKINGWFLWTGLALILCGIGLMIAFFFGAGQKKPLDDTATPAPEQETSTGDADTGKHLQ